MELLKVIKICECYQVFSGVFEGQGDGSLIAGVMRI